MKLRGEFIVRQIIDQTIALPVGQTALALNGMIVLNDVSKVIWNCLEQGTTLARITNAVVDRFEVSEQEARQDILEFLDKLRAAQLLDE